MPARPVGAIAALLPTRCISELGDSDVTGSAIPARAPTTQVPVVDHFHCSLMGRGSEAAKVSSGQRSSILGVDGSGFKSDLCVSHYCALGHVTKLSEASFSYL